MRTPANLSNQKSFYNDRWKDFKYINGYKLSRLIEILKAVEYTKISEPKFLDLGCGAGWLSNILSTIGPTTGIDLSEVAIAQASQRFPHIQFICADIIGWDYTAEFSGSEFDIIVSQEVVEHIEDQKAFLATISDLLRDGGYLILTTPNKVVFDALPGEPSQYKTQPIERWLTIRELRTFAVTIFRGSYTYDRDLQ